MSEEISSKRKVEQRINEQDVSVYAYDRSIVEDFRARFKNSDPKSKVNENVQIGAPESLEEDNVVMPFISLQRLDWQLNMDRQGFQTFIGDKVYTRLGPDDKPTQVRAQVIPITINYRLSVWSADRITNDALVREILWYYHLRPSLMVYVGHGLNIAHKFNIYFNSGIEDNSDIANHVNNGTYFRQDLTFYTDDAYLWRANWQDTVKINTNVSFSYENSDLTINNKDLVK